MLLVPERRQARSKGAIRAERAQRAEQSNTDRATRRAEEEGADTLYRLRVTTR